MKTYRDHCIMDINYEEGGDGDSTNVNSYNLRYRPVAKPDMYADLGSSSDESCESTVVDAELPLAVENIHKNGDGSIELESSSYESCENTVVDSEPPPVANIHSIADQSI